MYIHERTGKRIPVPRHGEMGNKLIKAILKEIP
ncbi:MAG: hypothetical protein LBC51_06320 [Treponema sp.]|nr:hypothetical protein [Treponema sp.]